MEDARDSTTPAPALALALALEDSEFEYFTSVFAPDAAVKRTSISSYLEGDGKKTTRTHFQRFTKDDVVRPVFDFDGKVDAADHIPDAQADLETRVAAALQACYPGLPVNLLASPGTVPAHFDRRSNRGCPEVHKVSVHAYVAGVRTDVATLKHAVCPRLAREFGLKPDTSIYSSARKLRMMGSAKTEADTRVLAPAAGSSDKLADYIAVAVDPAWPLHVVKPEPSAPDPPPSAAPETAPVDVAVAETPEDPLFARDVVAALADRRAEEREDWLRVGFALRRASAVPGAEDLFPLWDEFSARCPAKYDGAPALRRAWDAMDAAGRAGVTMGTLVAWARQDTPAAARAAEEARAARRSARGRGRYGGETGNGGGILADAAEAVRLISQKIPDHFPPGAVDAAMTADGKSLRVTAGSHAAVVSPTYDVAIAGRFVGNLVDDAELDLGALSWVHPALPTAARVFRYARPRAGETTLASVSAGAVANLLLTDRMVEVNVPGKRAVVSAARKRQGLYDSVVNAVNQYAAANMPAIHGALHGAAGIVNINNGGVQNFLVTQQQPEDDAGACESFIRWLDDKGYRPVSCDGRLIIYDPEEGIYQERTDHRGLRRLLRQAAVGDYSTSSSKQDALFKQLDDLAPEDPGFFIRADSSAKRKLAFANGVWDFEQKRLVPFSPDIVLFHKLPHRFPETDQECATTLALAREIDERVVDPIWTRSAEYVMQNTARAVAGEVEDRTYHFGIGDTASGKGVWMDIVAAALTSRLVGSVNSGNILWQRRSGDQAKNNSWLCAIRNNLINFTSEIQLGPGVFIDGNKLKELATGGESHTGRQNNQDEYSFRLKGCPWSFANDVPPIKPTDSAVKSRVRFVPMEHTFLVGEEYERRKGQPGVRRGDEDIKQWVKRPDVAAAFAWMLTQAYVPHKVDVPQHVSTETRDWIEEGDQDGLLETFVHRGGPDDFVSCKEMFAAAKDAGMEVSSVKLGRLVHKTFGVKSEMKHASDTSSKIRGFVGLVLKE